jgi:hypothetical protein
MATRRIGKKKALSMASWQRSSLVGLDAVVVEFEDSRSGLIDETSLAISQGTSLSEASLVMVNSGATKETVSISPSIMGAASAAIVNSEVMLPILPCSRVSLCNSLGSVERVSLKDGLQE